MNTADKKKDLKRLYLIYSSDRIFLDEALARLGQRFNDEGELDRSVFSIPDDPVSAAIDAACTLSMFGSKRLIILRNIQDLGKQDIALLEDYAKSPNDAALLVLVALAKAYKSGAKNSSRPIDRALASLPKTMAGLIDAVEKNGQVFEFAPPSTTGTAKWARDRLASEGASATPEAIRQLTERVGSDFSRLSSEIDKLALWAHGSETVDSDTIDVLVSPTVESGAFDLINAISDRKEQLALTVLSRLYDQGESTMRMLGLIAWHFRALIKIRCLIDSGVPQRELAAHMPGFSQWQINRSAPAALNFTPAELRNAYRLTMEAEFAIKSGRLDDRTSMVQLCSKILGYRNSRR